MITVDSSAFAERRAARAGTIRFGSLAVPAAAQHDVEAAFAYLSRDTVARSLIERIEHARTPHRILIDRHDNDAYDPFTRTIRWDPHSAMMTSGGGTQSPALGLIHELDHALQPLRTAIRLQNIADPDYDSAEERRVITGTETHAARTLHEARRYDHDGVCYRVPSPVMR